MEDQNGPTTEAVDNSVDQQSSGSLHEMLSEDLRDNPSLQDFKDVNSLAKSYTHAQSMLGKSVRIPGEDASEEQLEKFYQDLEKVPNVARVDSEDVYNKLGRPETPDKYSVEVEDENLDNQTLDTFKQTAHQLGLTNKQLNELVKFDTQRASQAVEQYEQYRENAEKTLRDTWGRDFDNRLQGAKEAISQYEEKFPEFAKELKDGSNPMANNPIVIAALSELHKSMQEKGTVSPQSGVRYGTSAEDAKEQLDEIKGNPKHPYWNSSNPGHNQAVNKVSKLYQIIYN